MSGLQKILKIYGEMEVKNNKGESVIWVWDYAQNKPRLKSEMSKDDFAKSEKNKYLKLTEKI